MKIFILQNIITASVLLLNGCMTAEKLRQRAGRQLSEFVSKSHNRVEMIPELKVADALYTVVHIKQQHYSELYNKTIQDQLHKEISQFKITELKEKYYQQICKINTVQKEIYDWLISSTSHKDFLFVEGRSYPHRYRDTFLAKFIPDSIAAVKKTLNTKGIFKKPIPDPPHFLGASIYIHKERQMSVLGAENLALLNLTLSLYESKKLSQSDLASFLKECHEAREDQMIKNMTIDFSDMNYRMSSLRFLICGSKHDFRNNVEKWNKENPQKKVNLLVVSPEALMEVLPF